MHGYHATTAAVGLALVGVTHFGPFAADPIAATHRHYEPTSPLFALIASGIVVALITALVLLLAVALGAHRIGRATASPAA